jgi:hypothetical protein
MCVLALGVMGCSETAGTGGTGGDGGSAGVGGGGVGGDGGSGGMTGQKFPCTEQGIRDAIAVGGGPHTFACGDGMTVVTLAEIEIDNEVILDGERNLTVDGNDDHRVFSATADVSAQLWGLAITGGNFEGGSGLLNYGALTLKDSTVSDNQLGGGIWNEGTLTITGSTISRNQIEMTCGRYCFVGGAGVHNEGTLTVVNSTVSENMAVAGDGGGIFSQGMLVLTNSVISQNTTMGGTGGGIANRYGTMTIADSTVSANVAELGEAGGIYNASGSGMTIADTTVSGNSAFGGGGGIANRQELAISNSTVSGNLGGSGGGILNDYQGELTLLNSRVVDNAAANSGGGIANQGYEPLFSSVTATDTTVSGNTAEFGGGIYNAFGNATMTLERSTISANGATNGGGIYNWGTLSATNSTVSGNTAAESGGGIMFNKGAGGSAMVTHSTISDNAAAEGSGIHHHSQLATLTLRSSLLEGECSTGPNATFTSLGYNIESPASTCGFSQTGDQSGVTEERLNLGPLAENDGPTMTHKPGDGSLREGSDAIDQIPEADCVDGDGAPLTMDQRGEPRPAGAESKCDVGSFEVQSGDR